MRTGLRRVAVSVMFLSLAAGLPAAAQPTTPPSALTVPINGKFATFGKFAGTLSINRFEQRGNQIVAVGFVSGVLSWRGRRIGTTVVGQVAWPVSLKYGGQVLASGQPSETARPTMAAWSPDMGSVFRLRPVQAEGCQVLDVALGALKLDLLGFEVALNPVNLNLMGVVGTPLGDLVCSVSGLLGNVAGLVEVLNRLLGLLTGLLGGVPGGADGAIPVA
jgi:hypothetical protein